MLDLGHRTNGSCAALPRAGTQRFRGETVLPGTEVPRNLWNVYIHENLLKVPTRREGRLGPQMRRQRRQRYLDAGANFSRSWNVWVALDTYLQLQEGFGWELFSDLFPDYRRRERGKRRQRRRIDEWITRTSRYTERNLVPFYEAWGFPITRRRAQRRCATFPTGKRTQSLTLGQDRVLSDDLDLRLELAVLVSGELHLELDLHVHALEHVGEDADEVRCSRKFA